MWHIIFECSKLAQKEFKQRQDNVARIIHWEIRKKYGLPRATSCIILNVKRRYFPTILFSGAPSMLPCWYLGCAIAYCLALHAGAYVRKSSGVSWSENNFVKLSCYIVVKFLIFLDK